MFIANFNQRFPTRSNLLSYTKIIRRHARVWLSTLRSFVQIEHVTELVISYSVANVFYTINYLTITFFNHAY